MVLTRIYKGTVKGISKSLNRFPLTIVFSILTTIILIILLHKTPSFSQTALNNLEKAAMIFALGIPISIIVVELCEKIKLSTNGKRLLYLLCAIILVCYYYFLLPDFKMVTITRYCAVTAALYLAFIYTPFIPSKDGIINYTVQLLSRFFTTLLYSVILYAGLAAILFTINKLLLVNIPSKLYLDLLYITAGIFAPVFFLSGVPIVDDNLDLSYPTLLKLLLIYIVAPLISIYTIILYIYFAKIAFTLKWPLQLVMHLVLWYSIITLISVFLTNVFTSENKWIKTYTSLITKLIIPLLAMMFISLGRRILSFGVTENRYYVLIVGLWLLGIFIYLNFKGKNYNIIPLSLSIIILLSVVGPWSCYSISEYSQNKRLTKILSKYNMLKSGKIIHSSVPISDNDKNEISNILYYFSTYHSLGYIKYLPKNFTLNDMDKVLGFSNIKYPYINNPENYFYYNADVTNYPVIDTKDYDYLVDMRNNIASSTKINSDITLTYDNKTYKIKLYRKNIKIYEASLNKYAELLNKRYGLGNKNPLNPKDMIFIDKNNNVDIKYMFFNINGHLEATNKATILEYTSFDMLLKLK